MHSRLRLLVPPPQLAVHSPNGDQLPHESHGRWLQALLSVARPGQSVLGTPLSKQERDRTCWEGPHVARHGPKSPYSVQEAQVCKLQASS